MNTKLITPIVWLGLAALVPSVRAQPPAPAAQPAGPRAAGGNRPADTLVFNFRGAPLEQVLNYLSEEAGYIIQLDTPVRGTIDAYSAQPITREEAMQLLNFALNKNNYTAVVQGRTISISSKEDAKKRNLPIRTGNDPEEIPNTAEMFIQIVPLRHLDATLAARDLASLLPGSAQITANADSNSLIVTDTNINLKQVVKLVDALDTSSDSVSTFKIFELKNADPYEMAALLTSIYASPAQGQNGQNGRGGQNGQNGRGGAAAAAAFGGRGGAIGGGGGAFGGFGAAGGRGGAGGRGTAASRAVPVVAVADPRTLKVIVTASKDQMPEIAEMVGQLDTVSNRKQQAFVYTMENANVKQVETILRNLFPSSNNRTVTNQQPDALTSRATANSSATATQSAQLNTTSTTGSTTTTAR